MSANAAPLPNSPGPFPVEIPDAGSSSLWDRIATWASEHKGTVYTIAGVTLVVTAAGAIYYYSDSNKDASTPGATSTNKRKNKRDRKKAKERAEKEAASKDEVKAGTLQSIDVDDVAADLGTDLKAKVASVTTATEDDLPDVDENSVGSLSEEVSWMAACAQQDTDGV